MLDLQQLAAVPVPLLASLEHMRKVSAPPMAIQNV